MVQPGSAGTKNISLSPTRQDGSMLSCFLRVLTIWMLQLKSRLIRPDGVFFPVLCCPVLVSLSEFSFLFFTDRSDDCFFLSVISNQSAHCHLSSDINQARSPTQLDIFSVNSGDGCGESPSRSEVSEIFRPACLKLA